MSSERKKLVKKLDTLFSEYIRERDKHRCVICRADATTHIMQCGHIFSRVSFSTRWDEDNAFCLCAGHNLRQEFDPVPMMRHAESVHGRDKYDLIYAKWCQTTKFTDADLIIMIEMYKDKLKKLKCNET